MHLVQCFGHFVAAIAGTVEEHESSSSGTGDFTAQGTVGHGSFVYMVDKFVGDVAGHFLLTGPACVERFSQFLQFFPQQAILHAECFMRNASCLTLCMASSESFLLFLTFSACSSIIFPEQRCCSV